jgi:Zn-finger nucleic acid-binding protein
MECQICKGILTPVRTNEIEILSCTNCRGFWVKRGDLNRLIKHKAGDIEFSSVDHHMHGDTHGILKCVYCEDHATIKTNFIGNSDVILDFCEGCGAFWVDAGEADKMQEYVAKIEAGKKKQTIIEVIYNVLYSLPKV